MPSTQSPRGNRAVTIRDVAERAGVSIATVSRVLDERRPSRSPNAERVRAAADALGYRRDASAANLRRGSTGTIGVVVPRLTDTVMAMLYEELAGACERLDRFAIVATTNDDPEHEQSAADSLLDRGVDGLVLATARTQDRFVDSLAARGVPHVLALRSSGTSLASLGDDVLGGYLAARHLIDLGHRDIGLIAGPEYASTVTGRIAGFRQALGEAGIRRRPEVEHLGSFSMEAGEEGCTRMMQSADARRPTAIFAMNDNTAVGALSALAQMNLRVPEQVSLIGYNDIPVASRLPVPLTTLRVPFRQIATSAVELLLQGPGRDGERVLTAPPTLIPRRSTAPPSTRR